LIALRLVYITSARGIGILQHILRQVRKILQNYSLTMIFTTMANLKGSLVIEIQSLFHCIGGL